MIEGNEKLKAAKCIERIKSVLDQYDLEIHPTVLMTPMGNEFSWAVAPKRRIPAN